VGFREALADRSMQPRPDQIIACGYRRAATRDALAELYDRLGGLPPALLVNSISCFEGALEFLKWIDEERIAACQIGVWDYDPLGELWRFPVPMVRQRAGELIQQAYRHLDAGDTEPSLTLIKPELILPDGG
jgi:LacI family fructose operon transcriptional repressor